VSLKLPVSSAPGPAAFGRAWQVGDALDLLAGLIAAGLIVLAYEGWTGLPRVLLTLGFVFFVPGRAIVTNWHRAARWSEVAISMVFSLTVLALVATITLWIHMWHPLGLFQLEAGLSLAALGIGIARRRRHRPDTGARQANPW
jgi:uncharacterized membrane protein